MLRRRGSRTSTSSSCSTSVRARRVGFPGVASATRSSQAAVEIPSDDRVATDAMTAAARARDAGDSQSLPRRRRARRRGSRSVRRRGAHPARRERRRQIDADEDPQRRLPQGCRRDRHPRRRRRDSQPGRRDRAGCPGHLPGAEPDSAPVGRGEHLSRCGADARPRLDRLAPTVRRHRGAARDARPDARARRRCSID